MAKKNQADFNAADLPGVSAMAIESFRRCRMCEKKVVR